LNRFEENGSGFLQESYKAKLESESGDWPIRGYQESKLASRVTIEPWHRNAWRHEAAVSAQNPVSAAEIQAGQGADRSRFAQKIQAGSTGEAGRSSGQISF